MKKVLQVMIVAIIAFNLVAMPVPESFADNPMGTVMTKFFNPMHMNSPSIIKYFDKVFDMGSGLSDKMIVSADNKPMLAVYKLNSGKCDWYKWDGSQWVYQYSFGNIVPGFEEPTTLNSYKYATWDDYTIHVVDTGNGNVVTPTNTLAVTLAGPTSGVINTAYTYTATITGGTIPYTLAWSADGFVSQNEAAANYKWTTGGIKKVEVYVTDSLGQTGSDSLDVTINTPMDPRHLRETENTYYTIQTVQDTEVVSKPVVTQNADGSYNIPTPPAGSYGSTIVFDAHGNVVQCFLEDTKVTLADYEKKKISELKVKDKVLSFNIDSNTLVVSTVARLIISCQNQYYVISLSNGTEVNVTPLHPFYTAKGYVAVKDLQVGEAVFALENGKLIPIEIVSKKLVDRIVTVYNLTVESLGGEHNFFADGILVHNKRFLGTEPNPGGDDF